MRGPQLAALSDHSYCRESVQAEDPNPVESKWVHRISQGGNEEGVHCPGNGGAGIPNLVPKTKSSDHHKAKHNTVVRRSINLGA